MLAAITDLPENPTLMDAVAYQATGLAVVVFALSLLYLICTVIGAGFKRSAARSAAAKAGKAPSPAPASTSASARSVSPGSAAEPALSPETVAAISGAVAAVLDGKHRILGIRGLTEPVEWTDSMLRSWSQAGRLKHFDSHKTR